MGKEKKDTRNGLEQIILNVVIIEAFSIVENWLLFFYRESQILPIIFGVLSAMMFCLLTINIYNCFVGSLRKGGGSHESLQAQAVLFKQMKKLQAEVPASVRKELDALKTNVAKEIDEVKKNQLRSTKAVMTKVEEMQRDATKLTAEGMPAGDAGKIMRMLEQIQKMQEELKGMLGNSTVETVHTEETTPVEEVEDVPDESDLDSLPEASDLLGEDMDNSLDDDDLPSMDELVGAFVDEEPDVIEGQASEEGDVPDLLGVDMGDPNKQLSADEIAALFSQVN